MTNVSYRESVRYLSFVRYDTMGVKECGIMGKKKDLRVATGISTTALAKLGKNEHVSTEILTKICKALDCDFCDIIELVKEENED